MGMGMKYDVDETWFLKDPSAPVRIAAGGVVFQLRKSNLFLALIREGDMPAWVLPKGGIEKNESPLEAAYREVHEEAGFSKLKDLGYIKKSERWNLRKSKWVETDFFLFTTSEKKGSPTDETRNYEQEWFDMENLPPILWRDQMEVIRMAQARLLSDQSLRSLLKQL
jgi:8-oxo-dGTP pyrophosphatase MutT (NUDIX family)